MVIRPATETDIADIDRVVTAAFGERGEEVRDLVTALRSSPDTFVPDLAFVAVDAGQVVGFVSVSRMQMINGAGQGFDALTLTPLAVDPAHERRGIGSALVEAAIGAARRRVEPLLFVEGRHGPASLYSRYFEPHAVTITAPPEVPNHEGFQMLRLPTFDEGRHSIGQAVYPQAIRVMAGTEDAPTGPEGG